MNVRSIIILFVIFFSTTVIAEEEDIIQKLTKILSTLNEAEEKSTKKDQQEPRDFSEQVSELNESTEQFISNNIAQFNQSNFAALNQSIDDENTIRDPFNLSNSGGSNNLGGFNFGSSFLPHGNNVPIPELKLRGVIYPKSNNPEDQLALLEIGNKDVFMVKVGDEISYDPRNPNAAIKIIKISRLTVTVQAGSLGNVLIVR